VCVLLSVSVVGLQRDWDKLLDDELCPWMVVRE